MRTVPVTMPLAVWGKLARIADREGLKVWQVVATAIERVLAADGVDDIDEAHRRAVDAVTRGWDDWTIAEQLGVEVPLVAAWRAAAGMKPCQPGDGTGPI